jgi:PPOX class probable FMN-dependent enzyme
MRAVTSIDELEEIYGTPSPASVRKVADHITPLYRKWIDASAVCTLATVGPEGVDASPRGDIGKVVFELDEKTLLMPDWRGNNRMDSLRNIVRDPRVALMLMTGGSNMITRVNGRAEVSLEPALIERFDDRGAKPRSVIVIHIEEIYFQCARALKRAEIWDAKTWPDQSSLPTAGQIIQEMSNQEIDGRKYDHEWPNRAKDTMW